MLVTYNTPNTNLRLPELTFYAVCLCQVCKLRVLLMSQLRKAGLFPVAADPACNHSVRQAENNMFFSRSALLS